MEKKFTFSNRYLPYWLILPQLVITALFFFWPAINSLLESVFLSDPFGQSKTFIWFENYQYLFQDEEYLNSIKVTLIFCLGTTVISLFMGLLFAVLMGPLKKSGPFFQTLLIWPYAVAPAVSGALWLFLFHPTYGNITPLIQKWISADWNPILNGNQALLLVILASSWKQISYNFIFFLGALLSIPKSLMEAATIDGASSWQRFCKIVLPLLTPTIFFLTVMNLIYAFFETFGVIHMMTSGGPGNATNTMVYKVYSDGFIGLDLGLSSAQSVLLMILIASLTVFQFKYLEKKVHYQ